MNRYEKEISKNAEKINKLHARIHETFKVRDKNQKNYQEWEKACEEFHSQYNHLAFPGGFVGAYDRILNGDKESIEAALCFIESRPYFFRSGYMFKDMLRKLKKAPLKNKERHRLDSVLAAYEKYRRSRNA